MRRHTLRINGGSRKGHGKVAAPQGCNRQTAPQGGSRASRLVFIYAGVMRVFEWLWASGLESVAYVRMFSWDSWPSSSPSRVFICNPRRSCHLERDVGQRRSASSSSFVRCGPSAWPQWHVQPWSSFLLVGVGRRQNLSLHRKRNVCCTSPTA